MPRLPKPRIALLRSRTSAPCSATLLTATEEPRSPCMKFVRMSSRSLAEVSLTQAYTFRPLPLIFLSADSPFLTFLIFCFTRVWCLACIIHKRKCPELSDCIWVSKRWNRWWRLLDANQNGFHISVFLHHRKLHLFSPRWNSILDLTLLIYLSRVIKKIRLMKFKKNHSVWLFL